MGIYWGTVTQSRIRRKKKKEKILWDKKHLYNVYFFNNLELYNEKFIHYQMSYQFIYWSISHSVASKEQAGITSCDITEQQMFKSQLNIFLLLLKFTLPWTIKIMTNQLLNERHFTTTIIYIYHTPKNITSNIIILIKNLANSLKILYTGFYLYCSTSVLNRGKNLQGGGVAREYGKRSPFVGIQTWVIWF